MTEQQKPLEEGWYWLKRSSISGWECGRTYHVQSTGQWRAYTMDEDLSAAAVHKFGPRLTPPQEGEG